MHLVFEHAVLHTWCCPALMAGFCIDVFERANGNVCRCDCGSVHVWVRACVCGTVYVSLSGLFVHGCIYTSACLRLCLYSYACVWLHSLILPFFCVWPFARRCLCGPASVTRHTVGNAHLLRSGVQGPEPRRLLRPDRVGRSSERGSGDAFDGPCIVSLPMLSP